MLDLELMAYAGCFLAWTSVMHAAKSVRLRRVPCHTEGMPVMFLSGGRALLPRLWGFWGYIMMLVVSVLRHCVI